MVTEVLEIVPDGEGDAQEDEDSKEDCHGRT